MPKIDCKLSDLNKLVGKKLQLKAVEELIVYAKGEVDSYDEATDTLRIKLEDTNQIYLWNVEGIALLFRGLLGVESGVPKLDIKRSKDQIIVDPSVQKVRPFIAAIHVDGPSITDDFIKQLIQFQEKVAEDFGMKRRKVSIGVYAYDKISWPVSYKAVPPTLLSFIPLEFENQISLKEILVMHPTGQKYASILDGHDRYPILIDANSQVLSFPPIINSNHLGKIRVGDRSLLVEVTGTDESAVRFVVDVFAHAFSVRGWGISTVTVNYKSRSLTFPDNDCDVIKLDESLIPNILGISLPSAKIKYHLERFRYSYKAGKVSVPNYRADIMHPVDIIEDIGISYGFDNLPIAPVTTFTPASPDFSVQFSDSMRETLAGLGFQESLSAVLSNEELLAKKMLLENSFSIRLNDFMSKSYSVVRSWILPILIDIISQNKHVAYPQFIFEEGETALFEKSLIESRHISFVMCDAKVDFTRCKQVVEALFFSCNLKCEISPFSHPSFVPGRCAEVKVNNKSLGFFGEIHPLVLDNFEIRTPLVGAELDLSALFHEKKNFQKNVHKE